MLSTKAKLQVARLLSRAIVGGRKIIGRDSSVRVRRQGIDWQLDLEEGIDFAIYLGAYQRIPDRVRQDWLRNGSLAVDIGANIGAFSLPLVREIGEGGRVIAVEPTDYAFRK